MQKLGTVQGVLEISQTSLRDSNYLLHTYHSFSVFRPHQLRIEERAGGGKPVQVP